MYLQNFEIILVGDKPSVQTYEGALIKVSDSRYLLHRLYIGWIPRIFRSFFCAYVSYFQPFYVNEHIKKCTKFQKNTLKYSWSFRLFQSFLYKTFLCSEMQSRDAPLDFKWKWVRFSTVVHVNYKRLLPNLLELGEQSSFIAIVERQTIDPMFIILYWEKLVVKI